MARLARIVVPNCPHDVTQRGNRREPIFFEDGDQDVYCDLLAEQTRKAQVAIWAYCLMPNHVHLIVAPSDKDGLARAIGETHAAIRTSSTHARAGAGIFSTPLRLGGDGRGSSDCRGTLCEPQSGSRETGGPRRRLAMVEREGPSFSGRDDGLVTVKPVLERVREFARLLSPGSSDDATFSALRLSERSGRPLANADFIAALERLLGRRIARRAPGLREPPRQLRSVSFRLGIR